MQATFLLLLTAAASTPAIGQTAPADAPMVTVEGTGTIRTPPDRATISFTIRGEDETADAATQALATKQKATLDALGTLLEGRLKVETGKLQLSVTRAGDCDTGRFASSQKLSTGDCAITGYIATMDSDILTPEVDDAATAAGLAARSGAIDTSVESYDLSDRSAARQRATTAALTDARMQAEAIAAGANVRLGPLLTVRDSHARSAPPPVLMVTARRPSSDLALRQPVRVPTSPEPIETTVKLVVTYALGS